MTLTVPVRLVVFRPYGKMYRTIDRPTLWRACRMLEYRFNRLLDSEAETPERAAKLRDIEERLATILETLERP